MADNIVGTHKPGSVTRIRLINFLTYSEVEFYPGPRLNLVCGPNGTGKSTILNAMCLGLGGEPRMLGRADDCREFISHGKDKALIEIEVQPFPQATTHIFRRTIDRNKGSEKGRGRGSSTYYLNGDQTTAKDIRKIVSDVYHISVDNLCTFLPQDRVGSFSSFNPKQLLEETEKSLSASQHLYATHQKLIELEAELNAGGNNAETLEKKLKALEADFANVEREKDRMEEREKALEQIDLLEKKMLWLKYDQQREHCLALKQNKDTAKKELAEAKKTLAPFRAESEERKSKIDQLSARFQMIDKESQKSKRECAKQINKFDIHQTALDEDILGLQTIEEDARKAERMLADAKNTLEQHEKKLLDQPDLDQVREELREAEQEVRTLYGPLRGKQREFDRVQLAWRQATEEIKVHQTSLDRINDAKIARRNQVFTQFPNLRKVADFVQNNQANFRRPVWGPVACEIETRGMNAAAYLEQHVPNHVFKSFVVECKEDWNALYKMVREGLKLPINILTVPEGKLEQIKRVYSDEKFEVLKTEHGVIGYLDESFTAPDPIMQAIRNEASVHRVLVGNDKTQESLDKRNLLDYLSKAEDGSTTPQQCCIFSSHGQKSYKYSSTVSRYSNATSLRVDDINAPRMLGACVDDARKRKAEEEVHKAAEDASQLKSQVEGIQEDLDTAVRLHQEAKARSGAIKTKMEGINKLKRNVDRYKRKVDELEKKASADNTVEKKKLIEQIKKRVKSAISALEAHSQSHHELLDTTVKSAGVRMNKTLEDVEHRTIAEQLREAEREFVRLETAEKKAKYDLNQAKAIMNDTLAECTAVAPLKDDNDNPLPLKTALEELPVDTVDEAMAALEEAQVKANTIDNNPDVMMQYEKLKAEIVETKDEIENLVNSKDAKIQEISNAKAPWEAALTNSLEKVNVLFSTYMSELGCAGEIVLKRGSFLASASQTDGPCTGKFDQWGVEIQVKFREKSKMSVLSAQRHSGGERAVSTIMYLMALQELMVSPFRCVDEINQGLDERNERLVFKRIVQNSTRPPHKEDYTDHSGQYFLITPKLLPNLHDMENEGVTVHIITNGPFTFSKPTDWNPDNFVEVTRKENGDENSPEVANSSKNGKSSIRKKRRVS
mmetsp:Transcript_31165/g.47542  ORF Transcript_31165/g.47542 Transcript_31165/m.47542 type:complete len:1125 (-) Transcript_31165:528-3902(-)